MGDLIPMLCRLSSTGRDTSSSSKSKDEIGLTARIDFIRSIFGILSLLIFFGIPCRNLARVELRYFEGSGALTCFVFFALLGFATFYFFGIEIAEIEFEIEVAFER